MGICRLSERVGLGSVSAVRVSACKCVASSVCAQVRPTKRAERQARLFHGLRWRPHVLDDDFRHHLSGVCVEARLSLNKARPSGRNAQCQAYIQQAEPEPRVQARRQLPHQHREAVAVRFGCDALAFLRRTAAQNSTRQRTLFLYTGAFLAVPRERWGETEIGQRAKATASD